MTAQLILIAGPYRSGTDGSQALIRCDAIYRIAGASKGADMDIEVARQHGLTIYTSVNDIPQNG